MILMRSGFSLSEIKAEIVNNGGSVTEPFTLTQAIEIADKTGEWNKLSDFALWGYTDVGNNPILFFSSDGTPAQSYYFITNEDWIITADKDWIHVDSKTGSGTSYIQVYCDKNKTNEIRTGRITIETKSGLKGSVLIYQHRLEQ